MTSYDFLGPPMTSQDSLGTHRNCYDLLGIPMNYRFTKLFQGFYEETNTSYDLLGLRRTS